VKRWAAADVDMGMPTKNDLRADDEGDEDERKAIDALCQVLSILSPLNSDDRDRVVRSIAAFYDIDLRDVATRLG